MRILVVDDDPLLRPLLVQILQIEGHYVEDADSLAGAREILGRDRFDVVVADYHMGTAETGDLLLAEVAADSPTTRRILFSSAPPATAHAHVIVQKGAGNAELLGAIGSTTSRGGARRGCRGACKP